MAESRLRCGRRSACSSTRPWVEPGGAALPHRGRRRRRFYRFTPEAYPEPREGPCSRSRWWVPTAWWPGRPSQEPLSRRSAHSAGAARASARRGHVRYDEQQVYMATTSDDRFPLQLRHRGARRALDGKKLAAARSRGGQRHGGAALRRHLRVRGRRQRLDLCIISRARGGSLRAAGAVRSAPTPRSRALPFDPSGTRLYFSSQRQLGAGLIYEVSSSPSEGFARRDAPELRLEVPASGGFAPSASAACWWACALPGGGRADGGAADRGSARWRVA